jgi:antitoxin MazE
MRKTLSRLGNSEALVITREMKELTGIGSEVEVEIHGNAIVITPVQAASQPETLERQARFAAARERILNEYGELFRKLADA